MEPVYLQRLQWHRFGRMVLYRSSRHADDAYFRYAFSDSNNRIDPVSNDYHCCSTACADAFTCSRTHDRRLREVPPAAARRSLLVNGVWFQHYLGVSIFFAP
jgi:hypothetical protein